MTKYRVIKSDGTIVNAGTGLNSYFNLTEAKKIASEIKESKVYEFNGGVKLWEVL